MTRPEKSSEPTPREREVRALLADQATSGLTLTDFCQKRGIPRGTLSCWGTVIRRRDASRARAGQPTRPPRTPVTTSRPAPAFVQVRVRAPRPPVAPIAGTPAPATPLEVVLPDGLAVRVPVGFDPTTLGAVLCVLEGRRC